jgi:flagellar export protein FliJ
MKKALETLKRVRETQKRGARLAFGAKERERQVQEAKVDDIRDEMTHTRNGMSTQGDGSQGVEACWVAQAHAYSLRLEVDLRRESVHLQQRTLEAEILQADLRLASQANKVVEKVLETIDEQEAIDAKRVEIRRMDDLAGRRWRRKGD